MGNYLIILLESDKKVRKLKGEDRPIHSQIQRKEALKAIKFINRVILLPYIQTDSDYFKIVQNIKPDIIATTKGDPLLEKKREQAKIVGAKLAIIPKVATPSTTQVLKLLKAD